MKQSIAYIIRYSARAKSVRLRVSIRNGVEVIVPQGYDTIRIPAFVEEKSEWIRSAQTRLHDHYQRRIDNTGMHPAERFNAPAMPDTPFADPFTPHRNALILPTEILLQTLEEQWSVHYEKNESESVKLITKSNTKEIILLGAIRKKRLCAEALTIWLKRYAGVWLPRMAREISVDIALPCADIRVRLQKTRWGSCSNHRNINLNASLLFLPYELTRYVIIHELCHTKEMNHSKAFWQCVAEKEPDWKRLDKALVPAIHLVPQWLRV